jgi:hypothetical protein
MAAFNRRHFLKAGLAGAALAFPMIGRANGPVWGDVPASVWPGTPPDIKILEIHLLGGTAPFESFYFRPAAGVRTRGFDSEITALNWNAACPGTPSGLVSQPFANDSNGKPVSLGPFAKPFWPTHISSRMRVLVLAHDLMPHEAAIPYVTTGSRLGRPTQASTGTAVQHRYLALDQDAMNPVRVAPYSYGLLPQNTLEDALLFQMMGSIGMHGGSAKPLVLRIGTQFATFLAQLNRPGMTADDNTLLDQLRAEYRDWLRFQGSSAPEALIRDKAFRDYDISVSNLFNGPALSTLLGGLPSTIPSDANCASETATFTPHANPTRTAIQAAVNLLTRASSERPRYVQVIDAGISSNFRLPYDVHNFAHATDTGSNLWNTLSTLAGLIRDPSNPTPTDSTKLDLTDTMIVINTEFGRTPYKSIGSVPDATSEGRDHWPSAFASVLIGGPITSHGVVGSISDAPDTGGVADISYTPTDMRAALLLAMNINPFENENFAQGSLSAPFATAMDHTAAMIQLRTTILGI